MYVPHCLVLDAVYRRDADGAPGFVEVGAPTGDELHALLQSLIARTMKLLRRRGVPFEKLVPTYLAEPNADGDEARTLRPPDAAAKKVQQSIEAAAVERQGIAAAAAPVVGRE